MTNIPLPTTDRYLTMCSTSDNKNKYYLMRKPVGDTFECEYGRIGGGSFGGACKTSYPAFRWADVYATRLAHGYTDISDIYFGTQSDTEDEEPINDEVCTTLAEKLILKMKSYVSDFVKSNYTVRLTQITKAMVNKADEQLKDLENALKSKDIRLFNSNLEILWRIIPRKIYNTLSFCASDEKSMHDCFIREKDYIDTIRGVAVDKANVNRITQTNCDVKSYCTDNEIKVRDCTDKEIESIKKAMGYNQSQYVKAYRVDNMQTRRAFNDYCKEKHISNVKQLFHGTKNENIYSILGKGLLTDTHGIAEQTGKMYGNGIYFSDVCDKALGYVSLYHSRWANGNDSTGYVLVYDVAMGKEYHTQYCDDKWNENGFFDTYDSVFAEGGNDIRRNEMIVYKNCACTIRYLIQIQ